MAIYRFKVTFENYDDVWREIDIRSDQTFEDFFYAIQQSIGFDNHLEASFYISNDQWKLGQQISSVADKKNVIALKEAVMHDWVNDPHQKIYYTYDPNNDWTFFIELVRIFMREDHSLNYPACVKVYGDAPVQYVRQPASAAYPESSLKPPNDSYKEMNMEDFQEETEDETGEEEDDILTEDVNEEDGFTSVDEESSENEQSMDDEDEQREY
jgi:hypothetical protein